MTEPPYNYVSSISIDAALAIYFPGSILIGLVPKVAAGGHVYFQI